MVNELFITKLCLLSGILAVVTGLGIFMHIRHVRMRKSYVEMFFQFYQQTGDVRNTLENILSACRWNQKIRTGIRQAIGYLNTSAIADYRTAFDLIENKISDDRIKYIHKACLYKERKKRCYLISDKGGEV